MALELSGKLVKVMPEMRGSGRNGEWVKQEFVIETNEQFPKKVCITAWGEKVDEIKALNPGDDLKVFVNIESREYNDKWYTDVKVWKFETAQEAAVNNSYYANSRPATEAAPQPFIENDDLPF
jgi:hypothetical protein